MKNLMVVMAIVVGTTAAFAGDAFEGKVISVIDGNTIEVTTADQQLYKLSLIGIDCPELGQAFGDQAKMFLEKLILNKSVTITLQGKDRLGNSLAVVKIKGSKDPRVDLLKEGLAWTAEKNPDSELDTHRTKAQQRGIGLWQAENPTPPWTYRRQQSMKSAKSL
jgi:endonuclease YncB( thermonuclease family)